MTIKLYCDNLKKIKGDVTGNMIYSRKFDEEFRYDGKDLGAVCTDDRTVFKVWSPMAERIVLYLYQDESAEAYESFEMLPEKQGVWKRELLKELHGWYYDYEVFAEGRVQRTADPYAVGCSCNGRRSMAVNLSRTNPEGFERDIAPARQTEQIIYELHVKDFSFDPDSGVPQEYRGKFKAFTVRGVNGEAPVCMEHLKQLGITHVHLLPIFDYGSLDEAGDPCQYNWGYDPLNFNVPEGTYATDPHDGTARIRQCKEMVQALHANGIRVVMDVVYNHTYYVDSWLERMVPGYYYRHWEDGSLSNGSACGNDIAAGRAMADNYIADSILYWAREYHIDGFRFDLMGLLTVELMNRIRRELDQEFGEGEKLLYGEPWRAAASPMEEGTHPVLKENVSLLDKGVAVFSDDTRDVIKGHVFYDEAPGFVNGGKDLERQVLFAVKGWKGCRQDFSPKSCAQIVNYISAHDNLTLWDKLVVSMHGSQGNTEIFTALHEDVMAVNKLAALICFTCQGNLFLQAGEEFGRTKLGDSNSYSSRPEINMLRWHQAEEFSELLDYYRGLIRLRKSLPGLYDKSSDAAERISQETIHAQGTVSFLVDNRLKEYQRRNVSFEQANDWSWLFILYNASMEDKVIALPEGFWTVLADEREADCRRAVPDEVNEIKVKAHSGMLLGKK